ncbi:MAG TPA: secretin N-terminal domain-containing protein, partial [Opitutaceae bacterium]|nr:secretin N-terminal domain-containing protein [Opitutaceae bacterium]
YTINLQHYTKAELINALITLLENNTVAVIPLGDRFLEVVPLAMVRSEAPEFIEGTSLGRPPSGQIVTKLFQLQYLRVNEFFNNQMIASMFTPGTGGGVVPLEKTNAALVTDTLVNIQRTERLLDAIDRPSDIGLTPRFYPLANASAATLVNKLHTILTGPVTGQFGTTTTYQADERSNQIVLLSDPRQWPFFDELIHKLDMPSNPNTRTAVILLKHADANTLGQTLTALISAQLGASQRSGGAAGPTRAPEPNVGNPSSIPVIGTPPPTAPAAPVAPVAAAAAAAAASGQSTFSNLTTIEPDERSNSIVVSGTVDDVRMLKDLIEQLDQALPQVRIQVVIAEVTLDDTDQTGLTALNLTFGTDGTRGTHITNFTGSVPGWDVTSGVVNPLAFQAALNSTTAGSKNLVKVLQADTIVVAHNKPGEINVGEQDPVINGGQSSVTGTGTAPVQSFTSSYQNIGIDLKITPLIGDNGDVQLTIDQRIDSVGGSTPINGTPQPIIDHREANSYVTVKNDQMIVLGGLQETQKTTTHQKLGLLFEIPILSQLFGGHTDQLQRTELLLFIRPHILPPDEGTADTKQRIDELSNKKQVDQFLTNPDKPSDDNDKAKNLIDRFKGD